jgi:nucleoside-diphosphate-sugar epimerase
MSRKRIFVTGASGCVGHYVVDTLIKATSHELFLLVRDPDKLKFDYKFRPGIKLIQADMRAIDEFADLLATMDMAILIATSWGGVEESRDVNITKTTALVNHLSPTQCEQIIYFSTASILDRQNQLLPAAGEMGTEYIRSKYFAYQALMQTKLADRITTIYPTMVIGGNDRFPRSHVTAGFSDLPRLIKLVRFFQIDGSFHFIHAQDIAQVVGHLVEHPPGAGTTREFVLGNDRLTIIAMIDQLCAYFDQPIYFRIPLYLWLTNIFVVIFQIQMGEWEKFSLNYRHFTHATIVTPKDFGLTTAYPTLADVLRISGVPCKADLTGDVLHQSG